MKISDNMVRAAQAAAPEVDRTVIVAILQAGLIEASTLQLTALCEGVARLVAVVDTPTHSSYGSLISAAKAGSEGQ